MLPNAEGTAVTNVRFQTSDTSHNFPTFDLSHEEFEAVDGMIKQAQSVSGLFSLVLSQLLGPRSAVLEV